MPSLQPLGPGGHSYLIVRRSSSSAATTAFAAATAGAGAMDQPPAKGVNRFLSTGKAS